MSVQPEEMTTQPEMGVATKATTKQRQRKKGDGEARRKRSRSRAVLWRRLGDPRLHLPLLLLVAALALLFAWQLRQPFVLDVGGPDDAPYLGGVHAGEVINAGPDAALLTYRWTQATTTIAIPGYGATDATLTLRLQGARPNEAIPSTVLVAIGDAVPQSVPLAPEMRDYTFPVDRQEFRDGGLKITLMSPVFRPSGDARDLGVPLDTVTLRDAGGAVGLIAPPLAVLGLTLFATLVIYGIVAVLLSSALCGLMAGTATAAVFIGCALGPRFIFTLFAPELAWITGAIGAATLLTGWAAWRLGQRFDWASTPRALGGAALIAGANLLLLLVGMRHPQFRSSDLRLNIHRLEFVQRGEWVFTLALPGERALQAPYPPLFYATMLPLANFVRDSALLVEATAATFIAASALLTFALARRVTGADGAALWAAGIWSLLPITYGMASAGNFANLFGQGVANLALVALVLAWGRWDRPFIAFGLVLLLILALLSHFGVYLSLLATVPLLAIVALFLKPTGRRQALALALCFAAAVAITWALYYRFHSALLLGHAQDFLGGETEARGSGEAASLAQRLRNLWGGLLLWWGWPALPLALAGINLLRRVRPSPQLWLALAWLGSALGFALGELVAGLGVRYHLFVGPALAVATGWGLWQLWRSHRHFGPVASLLIGGFWLWQSLAYWTDRVLHAYH